MRVERINNSTNFKGNIIYPKTLTPKLEKFKQYANEEIKKLIKDQPVDILIVENKEKKSISVGIKPTIEGQKQNGFLVLFLSEIVEKANDKILTEEVGQFMSQIEISSIDIVLPTIDKFKQNNFVPRKIGRNCEISSHPKFNKTSAKYVKRS